MSEFIESQLGHMRPVIIYDYPASQAALAKTCTLDYGAVAQRFEVYIKGVELANAYHELCDQIFCANDLLPIINSART